MTRPRRPESPHRERPPLMYARRSGTGTVRPAEQSTPRDALIESRTRRADFTVRPRHPRHGILPDWATTGIDTPEEANHDDVAS
ncbi:hypothetical protein ACWDOP_28340 [Nocardia sp. NPDC003693]